MRDDTQTASFKALEIALMIANLDFTKLNALKAINKYPPLSQVKAKFMTHFNTPRQITNTDLQKIGQDL